MPTPYVKPRDRKANLESAGPSRVGSMTTKPLRPSSLPAISMVTSAVRPAGRLFSRGATGFFTGAAAVAAEAAGEGESVAAALAAAELSL